MQLTNHATPIMVLAFCLLFFEKWIQIKAVTILNKFLLTNNYAEYLFLKFVKLFEL